MTGGPENNWRNLSDETGRWLDVSICSRYGTNLGSMLETAPWIRTLPAGACDNLGIRHVFVHSRRDCSDLSYAAVVYEEHFRK